MSLTGAATLLADVLSRENDALSALDFAQSAVLSAEKERAIAAFNRAVEGCGREAVSAAAQERLRQVVAENRRLLERSLHVQGQVIACIARAARATQSPARAYGATGAWAGQNRAVPMALAARI